MEMQNHKYINRLSRIEETNYSIIKNIHGNATHYHLVQNQSKKQKREAPHNTGVKKEKKSSGQNKMKFKLITDQ